MLLTRVAKNTLKCLCTRNNKLHIQTCCDFFHITIVPERKF